MRNWYQVSFLNSRLAEVWILRGVHVIDVREPDDAAAPAAGDERAVVVAHGKRRRAEEIAALDPLAFEGQLVVAAGRLAGPGDAGHLAAALHDDRAVADDDLSLPAKIGHLPAFQRLAVEEILGRRRRFVGPLGSQHRPRNRPVSIRRLHKA